VAANFFIVLFSLVPCYVLFLKSKHSPGSLFWLPRPVHACPSLQAMDTASS
jgi:hypothetical protein